MNATLLVLALLAPAQEPPPPPEPPPASTEATPAAPAPVEAPARSSPRRPNAAVSAIAGGAAAATGALIAGGGGLMMLSLSLSGVAAEPELVAAVSTTILLTTPLVTALSAGLALNFIYDGDCASYLGVLITAGYACAMAYLCAAAVAVIPLLALGGGSGSGCNPGSCNGCNGGDPCRGLDIKNAPRDEVSGGIIGAGLGLAVGGVVGFFFPIAVVETGGTLPPVGFLSGDAVEYGLFLGGGLGTLGAAIGAAIGVAVNAPDAPAEAPKTAPRQATLPDGRRVFFTYEVPLEAAPPSAGLAY